MSIFIFFQINEAMVLLDLHGRSGICDRNLDLKLCNQHLVELIRCGKVDFMNLVQ